MYPKQSGPRRFLKDSAALAGLAVGAVRSASESSLGADTTAVPTKDLHAYGERSRFEASIRKGTMGLFDAPPERWSKDFGLRTPLQNSVGIITPASLHYVIAHGCEPPDIDPDQHRLLIHGMVDDSMIFSMEDLQCLPSVSRDYFLECNANSSSSGPAASIRNLPMATVQGTHGFTSCSEWTGVPVSALLDRVGVQRGAAWVVAEGSEAGKHTKSIPLEKPWTTFWWLTAKMASRCGHSRGTHCDFWFLAGNESTT